MIYAKTIQGMRTKELIDKAKWVRRETLKIHGRAQGTRIASSLSCVEIFTVLFYGNILAFDPKFVYANNRDRFIISKGHGAISLYPILADLGFFDYNQVEMFGVNPESILCDIPDPLIPGIETMTGSLGNGLGIACGIAYSLKMQNRSEKVFVLMGDGELNEGSIWEAVMFAGMHKLGNLNLIIDRNKKSMMGHCDDIIKQGNLEDKMRLFHWSVSDVTGHTIDKLRHSLWLMKYTIHNRPKALIANTVKGKGVPSLESDPKSHIRSLTPEEVKDALRGLE